MDIPNQTYQRSKSSSQLQQTQSQLSQANPLAQQHTTAFYSWLLSTYSERYSTTAVQTFLFTLVLFFIIVVGKFAIAVFQDKLQFPFSILPFSLPTISTYSFFDFLWDITLAFGIVILLQVIIHLVVFHIISTLSTFFFNIPTHVLPIQLLSIFGIIPFIYGTNFNQISPSTSTSPSTQQTAAPNTSSNFFSPCTPRTCTKFRFFFVLTLLFTFTVGLLCLFFHIPTTQQSTSNLFSYHFSSPLITTTLLSPFSWFQSNLPIFWIQGDGYVLDCLATNPSSPFSFSTSIADHSFSAYNSVFYPTPFQLESSRHEHTLSSVSDILNDFVNNEHYTAYRALYPQLELAAFSSRYDIEVGIKSDPIFNTNANFNEQNNLYLIPTPQRPFIPAPQSSSTSPSSNPPLSTPTHAIPTSLNEQIIQNSIPVLSLHQYHRFQQQVHKHVNIHQTPTSISIHTSITSDPTIFFYSTLILLITIIFYYLFTTFSVPQTPHTLAKFVLIILIAILTTLIITYYTIFPLIHIVNYFFSWLLPTSVSSTSAIFHQSKTFNNNIGPILAITLPSDILSQILSIPSYPKPEYSTCPDNFSLGFIPLSQHLFTSTTFFNTAFMLAIIATPFIYFVSRLIFLINTPLNYNNHTLQALYLNTTSSITSISATAPLHLLFSRFTGHHPIQHLLHLAKNDSLYISLNNATYLPEITPLSPMNPTSNMWTTLANIKTPFLRQDSIYSNAYKNSQINPPQYTRMYMDFLIEGCFNTTTARIYDLLFQTQTYGGGKKSQRGISNEDILESLSRMTLAPNSFQNTSKLQFKSTLCQAISTIMKPIENLIASQLSTANVNANATHPTLLLQLIAATFLLPTNIAMISGTVTPVRDQPNRFIHSCNNSHIFAFYLHQTFFALLQLQLAVEDLVRYTATSIDPYAIHKKTQGNNSNTNTINTNESTADDFLTPRTFGYLVQSSYQLSSGVQNILIQFYTPLVAVIQELVNQHFTTDKVTLNIALPQSLIPLFRSYLAQRP